MTPSYKRQKERRHIGKRGKGSVKIEADTCVAATSQGTPGTPVPEEAGKGGKDSLCRAFVGNIAI